jgi:hypothetical protein
MRTTPHSVFHFTLPGLVLMALTACGGGGNDGGGGGSAMLSSLPPQNLKSAPAPAEPFNIPAATLTASSSGNSYTAIYRETPNNGSTMFDGQEANSSTAYYYLQTPYQPLGLTLSSSGGQFDFLYNSTDALPSTLIVGSSGPLGSGTYYLVNTNDGVGSLTETYSVASNDASSVLLTTKATGTVNGQSINETINYAVSASGAFELLSVEILVNGTTLNFTNTCSGCWDY